jgi:hypothetical protein
MLALFGWSTSAQLTLVGGTLEVVGLALVAVDFWWPWLTRASVRLRQRAAGALERARDAALRVIRRSKSVAGSAKLSMTGEVNAAGTVTPAKAPSLAEMTRRLYEFERRVAEVESRQERTAQELRAELDKVMAAVQELIRRSKDEYLGWRIVGLSIALVGAICLSAANLVQ